MKLEELLGHAAPVALLRRSLEGGRLPHALLFQGPEGIGKGTAARILAATLLCEHEEVRQRPCADCPACRKIPHGNHPDLLVIERLPKRDSARDSQEPEGEGEAEAAKGSGLRSQIVVDQIRELSAHAAYAPREGSARVFLIDPADRMNHEAQNALLKTLEEPPGRSFLFLIASRPHLLLPTVRSRCLAVRFAPMAAGELASCLEQRGFAREEALARAALAAGRQGKALTLDPQGLRARREEILSALERLAVSSRALAELPSMAASVAGDDEDSLVEGLELIETLLRDAAIANAWGAQQGLVHADLAPRLHGLGGHLGAARASSLVRSIERLRGELRFNLNRTLVSESLLAAVAGGPLP